MWGFITRPIFVIKDAIADTFKAIWRGIKYALSSIYNLFFGLSKEDIRALNEIKTNDPRFNRTIYAAKLRKYKSRTESEIADQLIAYDEEQNFANIIMKNMREDARNSLILECLRQEIPDNQKVLILDRCLKKFDAEIAANIAEEKYGIFVYIINYFFTPKAKKSTEPAKESTLKVADQQVVVEAQQKKHGALSNFVEHRAETVVTPVSVNPPRSITSSSERSSTSSPGSSISSISSSDDESTVADGVKHVKQKVIPPFSREAQRLSSMRTPPITSGTSSPPPILTAREIERKRKALEQRQIEAQQRDEQQRLEHEMRLAAAEKFARQRDEERQLAEARQIQQTQTAQQLPQQSARELPTINPVTAILGAIDDAGHQLDLFMANPEKQRQVREQAAQMANQATDAAKQFGAAASSALSELWGTASDRPEDRLFPEFKFKPWSM